MKLFEHRHYWLPKTGLNTVVSPGETKPKSGLIIEACLCGAIRQIEFEPGKPPTIWCVLPGPAPSEK